MLHETVMKIGLPGPGNVLPYMAYTGMLCWTGYGFCSLCPRHGIIIISCSSEGNIVCPDYEKGVACTIDLID